MSEPRTVTFGTFELQPDPAEDDIAAAMALRLGDRGRALALLEELYARGNPWIRALKVEPQGDPLRSDPRFQSILRRSSTPRASAS